MAPSSGTRPAAMRKSLILVGAVTALLGPSTPLAAPESAPSLSLPLACRIGRTCEIQHYVDRDPGPGVQDYRCDHRTYDKHNGIDIRLLNLAAERVGTDVLAAAPGRVSRLRDGAPDISIRAAGAPSVVGRECGNGVVIDHGGGWETQYCHLQRGSVRVKIGDLVTRRQPIARAGLSGDTEFPHLHFTVRQATKIIDPFAPDLAGRRPCGAAGRSLWDAAAASQLGYKAGVVLNAGWASGPVTMAEVEAGAIANPTSGAPAVVAWFRLIGLEKGDVLELEVVGPGGGTLVTSRLRPLDDDKDEYLALVGKKSARPWPAGSYAADLRVMRGGKVALTRRIALTL